MFGCQGIFIWQYSAFQNLRMQKLQRNQKTLQLNQRLTVQLKAKIAEYVSKESESILSRRDFPILKFVVILFLILERGFYVMFLRFFGYKCWLHNWKKNKRIKNAAYNSFSFLFVGFATFSEIFLPWRNNIWKLQTDMCFIVTFQGHQSWYVFQYQNSLPKQIPTSKCLFSPPLWHPFFSTPWLQSEILKSIFTH